MAREIDLKELYPNKEESNDDDQLSEEVLRSAEKCSIGCSIQ